MIQQGDAGIIRNLESTQALGGFFRWRLASAPKTHGEVNQTFEAEMYWLNVPIESQPVRVHLFGLSALQKIGCIIAHAILDGLEVTPDELIITPLRGQLVEIIGYDPDAVRDEIHLSTPPP